MQLSTFSVAASRPLPVFVLADTSGSMSGDKIAALNLALREMLAELGEVSDLRSAIEVSVITFGGSPIVVQPLAPPESISLPELEASGKTLMGEAIDIVRSMLEDESIVPTRAFLPTIVLISDGIPTGLPKDIRAKAKSGIAERTDFMDWEPLKALHSSPRAARALRLAMGIGQDARYEMLSAFVNTAGVPVIRGDEAASISKFLRWVTLSVASRTLSRAPDAPLLADLDVFSDQELMI